MQDRVEAMNAFSQLTDYLEATGLQPIYKTEWLTPSKKAMNYTVRHWTYLIEGTGTISVSVGVQAEEQPGSPAGRLELQISSL